MKITIKHLLEVILGEEDLQFFLNKEIKMGTSIFSESGYRVDINITVIKVNFIKKLTTFFGWPPLYYFKGAIRKAGKETVVTGRIIMAWYPKYFFLIWFCLVFISLIIFAVNAVYLLITFPSSSELTNSLLNVGITLGGTALLLAFGVIILKLIKLISRSQKDDLKKFCKSLFNSQALEASPRSSD
ncbi:hypothetical protein [Methylomonas sp. DH-1]|uniref:hypothetical protein n=1 Tax=Methylomonas sp. (strain DH-1) TaxID=1727196 RepID=UPI000AB9263C|nr:hypothetical protein [Methylomonas sp. DH-1]